MASSSGTGRRARISTVRHGRLRRSSSLRNILKGILAIFIAGALSLISVTAYALLDLSSSVKTVDISGSSAEPIEAGPEALAGDINILLVGSDSRDGQTIDDGEITELNDVTMLLRISKDHKKATVVSFPRDLIVQIPSCPDPENPGEMLPAQGEQQFNSALQFGLGCVVKTVEELTGAEIPYAGLITFDGVINMSNAIGGVDVCLAQPIVDPNTDLDLPAGEVNLVGLEALQFLRTRYGVGDGGDISRISNQQVFMSAMVRKIKSSETLSDPGKVYGLAKAAVENITLSKEMASVGFMQSFAATVRGIDLDQVNFVQYPAYDHPYLAGRLAPDRYNGDLMMERILNDLPLEITDTGAAAVKAEADAAPADAAGDAIDADAGGGADASGSATGSGSAGDPSNGGGQVVTPAKPTITGQSAADQTCSAGRTQ